MADPLPSWKRTATPAPPSAQDPLPSWKRDAASSRAMVQEDLSEIERTEAEKKASSAEDELRRAILYEVSKENPLLNDEAVRAETERRLQERVAELAPPLYTTGYGGSTYASIIPTAPPQEIPRPSSPPTIFTALAPQTRAGSAAKSEFERAETAGLFDDAHFYDSIQGLSGKERQDQVDAYLAYKAAYAKLRQLSPKETGVTDEQLMEDLRRQVAALSSGEIKTYVDDPANRLGYTGDPLARAFQRQVETGVVPMLEPGQLEYVQTLDLIQRGRSESQAASAAESRLRSQGVEITRMEQKPTGDIGAGGKPVMETVQVPTGQFRPATEEEIKSVVAIERKKAAEDSPLPFYMTPERDAILANIEGSATGGTLFEKKYPTGATVESPTSWFLRVAMAVPNSMMGLAGEAFTPDVIESKEKAARPGLYQDASGTIYNIAQSRGLMGEIGDLYDFNPDPDMKQYAWLGKAAGFAGDIISPDFAILNAGATAVRGGLAAERAAATAGVAAAKRVAPAAEEAILAGSAEFLESLGLSGYAKKIPMGDVRLTYGAMLGDTYRAADVYERAFLAETAARAESGAEASVEAAHAAALAAAREAAPRSRFIADAEKAGASIVGDLGEGGRYFGKGAKEWQEYRKVSEAESLLRGEAELPRAAVARESQVLRPYLASAVRNSPELKAALGALVGDASKSIKLSEVVRVVSTLPEEAAAKFWTTVKDSAALQNGFKAIDRGTKGVDPGRFVVKVTPRTFATTDTADKILSRVKATPEYALLSEVMKRARDKGLYTLTAEELVALRKLVLTESTTGSLPRSVASRILNAGDKVSPQDLREILYSIEDGVALQMKKGFRSSMLAEESMRTIPGRGQAPLPGLRSEYFGEDTGFISSALRTIWKKMGAAIVDKPTDLRGLLNPEQIRIVEDAKREIGNLPKRLELALKGAEGANFSQKLISLSLRTPPGQTASAVKNIEFWRDVAKTSVFGVKDRSKMEFILGEFSYDDVFALVGPEGREAIEALSQLYTRRIQGASGLHEIERLIPEFVKQVRNAVDNARTIEFMRAEGAVFDLSAKPQEVLLGTWARKESGDIHESAVSRILDFEPDTLGDFSKLFREKFKGIKSPEGREMGDIPLNTVVAQILREGKGSITSVEDILAIPGIKKWVADLDRMTGRAPLVEDIKTAADKAKEASRALGGSVSEDLRRAESLGPDELSAAGIEAAKKSIAGARAEAAVKKAAADAAAAAHHLAGIHPPIPLAVEKNLRDASAALAKANAAVAEGEATLARILSASQADVAARSAVGEAYTRARGNAEDFIRNNVKALFEDAVETASAISTFHFRDNGAQIAEDLERLYKGEGTLGEIGGPLGGMLSEGLRQTLGEQPKFREFMQELGALAELGAKGNKSAFGARRMMTNVLDSYNNAFYTLMLYINPRFHGTNILTAPLLGYSTTGRVPGIRPTAESIAGVLPAPFTGKTFLQLLGDKADIIDRYGVPWSTEAIYDACVKAGAFKSEYTANIDARFLGEAQALAKEAGLVTKIKDFPSALGMQADIVWRVAYVRDALKEGKTMEEALDIGRASLYDYGSATEFERKYIAKHILFYNFFRNNVFQTAKGMLTNPGRFARQVRLTQDVSKMVVGEEQWNELRFYTPMDAGVSRLVLEFAPAANREGKITLGPQMSYYDAVYIISGLLTGPVDLLLGAADPITGERPFGEGYAFGKLRPNTQTAYAMLTGKDPTWDSKVSRGRAPVPHLALMEAAGMLPYYTALFNMKSRPAAEGEDGFDGKVYEMSDADAARYAMMQKFLGTVGAKRAFSDFGKWAATLDIFGTGQGLATGQTATSTVTLPSALGITTQTKAGIPVASETKAAEVKAAKLAADAAEREKRSGLKRK